MRSLKMIANDACLNEKQLKKIEDLILSHKVYEKQAVREVLDWFCSDLGMARYYFKTTPIETIAGHIEAVKAAEIMADVRQKKELVVELLSESKDEAFYLVDDTHRRAIEVERRIEKKYPNYRIQSLRTGNYSKGKGPLRMYLVYRPKFSLRRIFPGRIDLKEIADFDFIKTALKPTYQRYQEIIQDSTGWETPIIKVSLKEETGEHRIMIAVSRASSYRFSSNISDVINSHNLVSNRKYVEQFSNGKTVYTLYIDRIKNKKKLLDLIEDITLVYVIPDSPISELFRQGKLKAQETVFGMAAWSFTHQFLSGYNEEYLKLAAALKESPELLGILRNLKVKLAKDTYTEPRVWEALVSNYTFLKQLFKLFERKFNPYHRRHDIKEDLERLRTEIFQSIPTEIDRSIFCCILLFIEITQRTNFYKKEKNSLAFMYSPGFLNEVDYSEPPFGIFHVIGIELRGFHIRFRDISRGGIRLVASNNYQNYIHNSDTIFDENYNLAATQQRKNKDIPEGGSKGAILLRWGHQDKAVIAFKKYVNGLLDLLMPNDEVIDFYGREVILFLGPDEGTADLMEWASRRARILGYPYWKSFTTGKPISMGGIPHDLYGMTTNSVHQYVLNLLQDLDLKENKITKIMTGGPDGDLGSNEILISRDKIIAIIDGSGVIYDPRGLNRPELERLAVKRKTVNNFDRKLLSPAGFLVRIEDRNITLPDGEKVFNGLEFRNFFHLSKKFKADLFVPCGGRPASITINNWTEFLDEKGKPRFRFISEGANLFLTQGARLRLEEKGVYIYKDASANKGGVTSSSLEVFASLALSDDEYEKYLCVKKNKVPLFRKKYVAEILRIIRSNSDLEYRAIEKEHKLTRTPRVIITDLLSDKINDITDSIFSSELYKDKNIFKNVISGYCPRVLLELVGWDELLQRVPAAYLRAIFASRLASKYVYSCGLDANELDFFNFIKHLR